MKKMIGLTTLLLLAASNAYAGSGKAIVPLWAASPDTQWSNIFVSNITNNDLLVYVTFYKSDGGIYTNSALTITGMQNGNTEIGAKKSANIRIDVGTAFNHGWGIIEWVNKSGDDDAIGLIGHAKWTQTGNSIRGHAIPINSGQPF